MPMRCNRERACLGCPDCTPTLRDAWNAAIDAAVKTIEETHVITRPAIARRVRALKFPDNG